MFVHELVIGETSGFIGSSFILEKCPIPSKGDQPKKDTFSDCFARLMMCLLFEMFECFNGVKRYQRFLVFDKILLMLPCVRRRFAFKS